MNNSRTLSAACAAIVLLALSATPLSTHASLVFTEFLADPASGPSGDANGDGYRHASQDEFIELVNTSAFALDIGNWTLSDNVKVRHLFPPATSLPAGDSVVVFGGGTPTGIPGLTFTASSGALSLNNDGDSILLMDATTLLASVTYGAEGGQNESLTRFPLLVGDFVGHSAVPGAEGVLFSPGTLPSGMPYSATSTPGETPAAPVPEPGTLALFAIGILGLSLCNRGKSVARG